MGRDRHATARLATGATVSRDSSQHGASLPVGPLWSPCCGVETSSSGHKGVLQPSNRFPELLVTVTKEVLKVKIKSNHYVHVQTAEHVSTLHFTSCTIVISIIKVKLKSTLPKDNFFSSDNL